MLKKGVTIVKFTRPASAMRVVLAAVEQGIQTKREIAEDVKLSHGKVDSALRNLAYIGAIVRSTDSMGRSIYTSPGRIRNIAPCLMGVRSIFDVATAIENSLQNVNTRKD